MRGERHCIMPDVIVKHEANMAQPKSVSGISEADTGGGGGGQRNC